MNGKHLFREYFSYTASEKKGLLVLMILLLILYLLPYVFQPSDGSESIVNIEKQNQIDSLVSSIENKMETKLKKVHLGKLDFFDPNSASKEKLLELGFTTFQSSNLIKFREKGGRFKKKKDLLKIYGFDQADLDYMNDYIQISMKRDLKKKIEKKSHSLFEFDPNSISSSEWEELGVEKRIVNRIGKYLMAGGRFNEATDLRKIYGFDTLKIVELLPFVKIVASQNDKAPTVNLIVPLNTADTSQLKQISGIGSVFSARIVKYRRLLGGYVSKEQLLEVYGISKDKLTSISSKIIVDSIPLKRIGLNTFEESKLRKHPYINSRMAKDIVRFRERNGEYRSVDQLKTHKLVPDTIFIKLLPYLNLK